MRAARIVRVVLASLIVAAFCGSALAAGESAATAGQGPHLHRPRRRRAGRLRPLRRRPAKDLTMIVEFIYAAAALAIGVYMVAALLRPDRF